VEWGIARARSINTRSSRLNIFGICRICRGFALPFWLGARVAARAARALAPPLGIAQKEETCFRQIGIFVMGD
jgi:hypothetical protein